MHGTCLSGLYPVPFTHNSHDYPHFNIYISFGDPKYCITALNTYAISLFYAIFHLILLHLCKYYKKSLQKSPKYKNIVFINDH
ncbi:AVN_collapsed_G0025420.mRNA.1.CDS.1 [Saccharomyces cerevisiae]|nr:AVN_collapsed_G0025420.mRNA.1.CDS.1 [Saccharomyces cerevisiae]